MRINLFSFKKYSGREPGSVQENSFPSFLRLTIFGGKEGIAEKKLVLTTIASPFINQ